MTIWEILEIPLSANEKEIKSAYAKKVKQFNPEENQEKFQEVYNAYKQAIKFLKNRERIIQHRISDPSPEIRVGKNNFSVNKLQTENLDSPKKEYNFDFSEKTVNSKKSENIDSDSDNQFDFNKLEKELNNFYVFEDQVEAEDKKFIQAQFQKTRDLDYVSRRMNAIYLSYDDRNNEKSWSELFSSVEFKRIKTDDKFLEEAYIFFRVREISPKCKKYILSEFKSDLNTDQLWSTIFIKLSNVLTKNEKNKPENRRQTKSSNDRKFKPEFIVYLVIIAAFLFTRMLFNFDDNNVDKLLEQNQAIQAKTESDAADIMTGEWECSLGGILVIYNDLSFIYYQDSDKSSGVTSNGNIEFTTVMTKMYGFVMLNVQNTVLQDDEGNIFSRMGYQSLSFRVVNIEPYDTIQFESIYLDESKTAVIERINTNTNS